MSKSGFLAIAFAGNVSIGMAIIISGFNASINHTLNPIGLFMTILVFWLFLAIPLYFLLLELLKEDIGDGKDE